MCEDVISSSVWERERNRSLLAWGPGSGFKPEKNGPKSLSSALPELPCSSVLSTGTGCSKSPLQACPAPCRDPHVLVLWNRALQGARERGGRQGFDPVLSLPWVFLPSVDIY